MPMRIRQPKWDHRKSLCHVCVKIKDFEIDKNNPGCKISWSAVSRSPLGFCTMNTLYKARVVDIWVHQEKYTASCFS